MRFISFIKQVNRFTLSDFDWNLIPNLRTPKVYRLPARNEGTVNGNDLRVSSGHFHTLLHHCKQSVKFYWHNIKFGV